jgi:hypothetical protein
VEALSTWPERSRAVEQETVRKNFLNGSFPIVLMAALVVVQYLAAGLCLARGSDLSELSGLVNDIVLLTLMGCWLGRDSRKRGIARVWDIGFFYVTAWPIVVPSYLVRTRGIKRAAWLIVASVCFYLGIDLLTMLVSGLGRG